MDQIDAPRTLSVPEAGKRYFGIGRNASYRAAADGTSRRSRLVGCSVPVARMERKLTEEPK